MGLKHGSSATYQGLVAHFDAANPKSYTASTWVNLINPSQTLSTTGTIPDVGQVGGANAFIFTGMSGGMQNTTFFGAAPLDNTNCTMEAWVYVPPSWATSGDRATIVLGINPLAVYHSVNKSNNKLSNYWYLKSPEGYFETGEPLASSQWHHIVAVWNATGLTQYTNNVATIASTTGTAARSFVGLNIGSETAAGSTRQFNGGIAEVRMYNRALSLQEVATNYNASRGRYGV